jgi:hypothetical protein
MDLCRGYAARARSRRSGLIRVAPESPVTGRPDVHGLIQVRNHRAGSGAIAADELISTDAIALVRFGLRSPDDRPGQTRPIPTPSKGRPSAFSP